MSYPYFGSVHLGASRAAATIAATVLDLTGVPLPTQPTRLVVNLGGGVFGIHITDMPDDHAGWVVLKEGATVLDALLVAPAEVETARVVWAAAPAGTPAGDIADAVWAGAPPGVPAGDIADAVWAGAPPGTPVEDIADAVWAGAPPGVPLSDIKAQVVEALATDTYPEVAGIPAVPATVVGMLRHLFKLGRNKSVTNGTSVVIRNDADTADSVVIPHAEAAGTFTRNKGS